MTAGRTALVVVLDEAERVVEDFRERFDPAVERMIPAHVTVIFPFADIDAVDIAAVQGVYSAQAPFHYELARIERFPEHVWLAPEPKNRFVELITRTIERFPDQLPYGGVFEDVIPHLTIASGGDVDGAEAAARAELGPKLPMPAGADEVALLGEQPDGTWRQLASFRLGGT